MRSADAARPVAGVLVALPDSSRLTLTNQQGEYRLAIPHGLQRLVLSRPGFASRTLAVVAGSDSVIDLDVTLEPFPSLLRQITVRAAWGPRPEGGPVTRSGVREPGEQQLRVRDNPALIGDDVLAAIATSPDGVETGPDRGASLHVRGGASDQNLVLVDGVPSYEARHMVGTMSVLNADVVGDARLHAGVPPARFGDALSSVIELQTRELDPRRWATSGGISLGLARVTMTAPAGFAGGAFMVSGRQSIRSVPGFASGGSNTTLGVGDLVAKATFPLYGGRLEALSLAMTDEVGFAAIAADEDFGKPEGGNVGGARNRLGRGSRTLALVWQGSRTAPLQIDARLWRSRSATSADWLATATSPVTLGHSLRDAGVAATVSWNAADGRIMSGVQLEQLNSRYRVTGDSTRHGPRARRHVALTTQRAVASLFAEGRWAIGPRWAFGAGARDRVDLGGMGGFEPRVSVDFRARERLLFAASAGRVHQALQSLSNGESIFDSFLGGGLMVVARGAPATADRASVGAVIGLSRRASISIETYAGRLLALTLPAPRNAQPFAIDRIVRGGGRASGTLVGFNYDTDRLSAQAAFALSSVVRSADGLRYRPRGGDARALSAAMAYRWGANTVVRAAMWAASGRRTTLASGNVEWASAPLTQGEDVAGTQSQWLGALGAQPLPNYLRLDLGVRHTWQIATGSTVFDISGTATVLNVLDRADVRTLLVPESGGARRVVPTAPRMLLLGLDCTYQAHP